MWAFTRLPGTRRNLPCVFCASSQAISAEIIGLRAKAMAMPVEKCSDGAASDDAAMFIHGTWWPSVNSMPEKPASSTRRASVATLSQVVARVMTSNSMVISLRRRGFATMVAAASLYHDGSLGFALGTTEWLRSRLGDAD